MFNYLHHSSKIHIFKFHPDSNLIPEHEVSTPPSNLSSLRTYIQITYNFTQFLTVFKNRTAHHHELPKTYDSETISFDDSHNFQCKLVQHSQSDESRKLTDSLIQKNKTKKN